MFGRKSNQIKALKQELEIKDRTLADRHQIITIKNQELESLKEEREGLKARVKELEKINKEIQSQFDSMRPPPNATEAP